MVLISISANFTQLYRTAVVQWRTVDTGDQNESNMPASATDRSTKTVCKRIFEGIGSNLLTPSQKWTPGLSVKDYRIQPEILLKHVYIKKFLHLTVIITS